jgi:protein-disulfide isomerase
MFDIKQKLTYIVIGLAITTIFLVGVYFLTNDPSQIPEKTKDNKQPEIYEEAKTIKEYDHTKWSDDKKIVLTEYSDMECPACGAFHQYLKTIDNGSDEDAKKIKENVTFVYRHYPLENIHPKAKIAAIAAEAAANQDKFFPMLDILYDRAEEWSKAENTKEQFTAYAKELKLDTDQFKKDMDDPTTQQKVETHMNSGDKVKITGTPTFFLNGRKLDFGNLEDLKKEILQEID